MSSSGPTKDFGLIPIPQRLRCNPTRPFPEFGIGLNLFFAFACTFVVANLYYCQPLLIQFSEFFGVSYLDSSRASTILQAGYATGLFFLAPLGDLIRRRQLILGLLLCSTVLTLCLGLVHNWTAFLALSFLAGTVNIVPQVIIPLTADVASPSRRHICISIVVSGLIMGVLVARVFAGIIAQYTEWRTVYYFAVGMQLAVFAGCYAMIPDYPAKNGGDLVYWELLWSMMKYAVGEPLLIQACLMNLLAAAGFSNFWVTLTFLLGGPPYNYSTLEVGLFGLIGISGVCMTPLASPLYDKLHPWYSAILGSIIYACFQALLVGAAGIHIAPGRCGYSRYRCLLPDPASLASNVNIQFSAKCPVPYISETASTSLSRYTELISFQLFLGQVMGADVGSRVFLTAGWRAGAGLSLGWTGACLLLLLLRGPHCERNTWFGYEGGFKFGMLGKKVEPLHEDSETGEKGSASEGNLQEISEVTYTS
ncbi:MFS general substrate transporter [Armillaria solidipes]|uniref:MFS general substrate transporter n=1 Tax=Armillaria solidipes TaxID=1076256 RepID=A0A2H3B9W9_9AGAR|nr:MFS general substrate transporter [Armillaria solidipes]